MRGCGRGAVLPQVRRAERGQMALELAVLAPVIIVFGLVAYNLMSFVELSALFDRVALDAVVSQGIAPSGTQSARVAEEEVRACIQEALHAERAEVEVSSAPVDAQHQRTTGIGLSLAPLLTEFTCTLRYRPWPGSLALGPLRYESPIVLMHTRSLVVDRYRGGVVV